MEKTSSWQLFVENQNNLPNAKCPRCDMIERRADQNIHQANQERDAILLTFQSKLAEQLKYLFADIEEGLFQSENDMDPLTGFISFQRLVSAKQTLNENNIKV